MSNNVNRKPKRFLNTQDAADYIDRNRSTLDKWRAAKIVLPFFRDGGKVMYDVADLDAYLDRHKVIPIAEVAA